MIALEHPEHDEATDEEYRSAIESDPSGHRQPRWFPSLPAQAHPRDELIEHRKAEPAKDDRQADRQDDPCIADIRNEATGVQPGKMTTCPAAVKPVPVLRTPSPVSVTADVAVKKASSGETELPSGAENGISSKKVPSAMRPKNPTDTSRARFCVRDADKRFTRMILDL